MTTSRPLLLLVDDDPLIVDALGFALAGTFDVITADSRPQVRARLSGLPRTPDLALIDLGLPPYPHRPDEGLALIGELLAACQGIRMFVLSGQQDESHARRARVLGALGFIGKPCDPAVIIQRLTEALALPAGEKFSALASPEPACRLIGNSPALQLLRQQLAQYADSSFPVLVEGESGSGKDIVASCCLHQHTRRGDRPFLAINCAAIAPSLIEPTLFGHAKGAFTGAAQARAGYFEEAGDGTLFLDEIGELPAELQPKLLRVLENGEYQRVGETQTRRANARIITATNRDLKTEVRAGRFRADLYHRLSVFTVRVPPLREMDGDKTLLLDHFRQHYAALAGTPPFTLDDAARTLWNTYSFPGNGRELRNIVIRLTARYPNQPVSLAALHAEMDEEDLAPSVHSPGKVDPETVLRTATQHLLQQGHIDLDQTLALWEQSYIDAALAQTQGNVSEAARRLGINRTTLYNRMQNRPRP